MTVHARLKPQETRTTSLVAKRCACPRLSDHRHSKGARQQRLNGTRWADAGGFFFFLLFGDT